MKRQATFDYEPDVLTVEKMRAAVKQLKAASTKPYSGDVTFLSPPFWKWLDTTGDDGFEPIDILKNYYPKDTKESLEIEKILSQNVGVMDESAESSKL